MKAVIFFALVNYFLAQSGGHLIFEEDVNPSGETEYDQIQAVSDRRGLSGCKWYGSAPFKCYSRKSFRGTGCPSGTYWIKDDSYGKTRKSNGALVKGNYCWFGLVKKYCCNNN